MRMTDVIQKKRDGGALSPEELSFFIQEYVAGRIPDYQAAALLMAIWYRGMDPTETAQLTWCMAQSGEMVDLSSIPGVKVDKHSTGGVGDKTTLVVAPLVAACGVPVAKMSGRGLGFTGGTIDKLESIPGLRTSFDREQFFEIVRKTGLAVVGQSGELALADKKLYALRDVTCTVDSLPLIASSIMSKKLAAGADAIVLDVKTGSGAFMKTLEESIQLAQAMVRIGEHHGRPTVALVTDMDRPLGWAVGNALEVAEAADTLRGRGPQDLTQLCLRLAQEMLGAAGLGGPEDCRRAAQQALDTGEGFSRLCRMVEAQGGDSQVLEDTHRLPQASCVHPVKSPQSGWLCHMETAACGRASMVLGAGRERKEDPVDPAAGLVLRKKPGDWVEAGEVLALLHTNRPQTVEEAQTLLLKATAFSKEPPRQPPLVQARVTAQEVERF